MEATVFHLLLVCFHFFMCYFFFALLHQMLKIFCKTTQCEKVSVMCVWFQDTVAKMQPYYIHWPFFSPSSYTFTFVHVACPPGQYGKLCSKKCLCQNAKALLASAPVQLDTQGLFVSCVSESTKTQIFKKLSEDISWTEPFNKTPWFCMTMFLEMNMDWRALSIRWVQNLFRTSRWPLKDRWKYTLSDRWLKLSLRFLEKPQCILISNGRVFLWSLFWGILRGALRLCPRFQLPPHDWSLWVLARLERSQLWQTWVCVHRGEETTT